MTDDFVLSGIALGTIVTIVGFHVARALAPAHLRGAEDGPSLALNEPGMYQEPPVDDGRDRTRR